jgi:protein TonB
MAQKITHLAPRGGGNSQLTKQSQAAPADTVASLDATLPPTPLKKLLAADGAAVYMLTGDSALVEAVTTAAGDQFPIQVVPTFKALRSLVDSAECKIVLLDAEPFGNALRARIAELKAIAPELVVLVAAPREVAEELMGLFSERVIHRLLIKPPAIGITRLLLESAVSRFLQLRESHEMTVTEPLVASRRLSSVYAQGSKSAWLLATALVSVLVAGVLIGGFLRGGSGDGANAPESAAADSFAAPADAPPTPVESVVGSIIATEPASDLAPNGAASVTTDAQSAAVSAPEARAPAPETSTSSDSELEGPPQLSEEPRRSSDTVVAGAAALIAAAAAAVTDREPSPTTTAPAVQSARAAPPPTVTPSELDSLLLLARARMERGQVLEPVGDSARDYVARAFALDSEDRGVLAMRAEIGAAIAASARVVLESGDIGRAAALTDEARRFGAPSETLAVLDVDLAAAREAAAAELAAVQRAQSELLATGVARIRQQQLVTPEGDSALTYLQRLRSENPDYPGLVAAWSDLERQLMQQVGTAIAAKNWASAEAGIVALTSVAEPETVDAVRADLAAGRLQEEYLATPARAGELRVLTVGQAEYPERARRLDVDGWVETEFVVGVDGVPRGPRVVEANPPLWFEQAALDAVVQYRYAPFERDGRAYERLARLRIRFDLR